MSHAPQRDGCRVLDRDSPGLRQGIARELRKHVAVLAHEIAELEKQAGVMYQLATQFTCACSFLRAVNT
jgi:hypothetical protein